MGYPDWGYYFMAFDNIAAVNLGSYMFFLSSFSRLSKKIRTTYFSSDKITFKIATNFQ